MWDHLFFLSWYCIFFFLMRVLILYLYPVEMNNDRRGQDYSCDGDVGPAVTSNDDHHHFFFFLGTTLSSHSPLFFWSNLIHLFFLFYGMHSALIGSDIHVHSLHSSMSINKHYFLKLRVNYNINFCVLNIVNVLLNIFYFDILINNTC